MHARLLHILLQSLLILTLFWLSLIQAGASASPTHFHPRSQSPSQSCSQYQPRSSPSPFRLYPRAPPPPEVRDQYLPLAAAYNLKFKKYSQWIKEQSKSLWDSHSSRLKEKFQFHDPEKDKEKGKGGVDGREDLGVDYVSPFLTRFADKHDSWWYSFDFGRMWRHFLWEVVPELWRSHEAPREDVFLLRAMEQPLYMSVDELPEMFRMHVQVQTEVGEEGKDGSEDTGSGSAGADLDATV